MRPGIVGLIAIGLLAGSMPALADEAQDDSQTFCERLARINRGEIDVSGLAELEGHVRVAQELLDVAPGPIAADLETFRDTFDAWARAVDGEVPMMQTFAVLRDPGFAGVQGRISDFIADHCGVRLSDVQWRVGSDASRAGRCPAWPSVGNPMTFNHFPNLPDISGGNYFSQRFWLSKEIPAPPGFFPAEPGGRLKIHGQYHRARYFAFHPNDDDLNNLETLRDRDLDPDPGSVNPFREVPKGDSANHYTAWLVFDQPPLDPAPNTSYVGARKNGLEPALWVWNLLRLYASDLGTGPNSGGVPLPAVTLYDAKGEVVMHHDECEPFAPGEEHPHTDIQFPVLPIADHRAVNPPAWSTSSNFDAPSDTLANADVQYLATFYARRHGDIFVVRARQLETPDSRHGEPVSASGKDMRLFTLCTYNIWSGSARQCLLDHDLRVDDAGFYTLVVTDREHVPSNLEAAHATWIDWGPYLDGQLTWRMVYRENPFARRIAYAKNGGIVPPEMAPYIPRAAPCTRTTFEEGGWQACFEAAGLPLDAYR